MKQDVTLLGGPSDGLSVAVRSPLADTFPVTSEGDQTLDYLLVEHPLTHRKVYAHPAVYARLIHGQTGDGGEVEEKSTED